MLSIHSGMNLMEASHQNRVGDEFMNDCLVTYIERDIFKNVNDEKIYVAL